MTTPPIIQSQPDRLEACPRPRPGANGSAMPTRAAALAGRLGRLACRGGLASLIACAPLLAARAGNLTSLQELAQVRSFADQNITPMAQQRAALLGDAQRPWRWGSVSGEFVTTLAAGLEKRCHPAGDPNQVDYLKEGAPDAYAKVLGYFTAPQPDPALATEARARVLDLIDTRGFNGLLGDDLSGSNQCILELALSIPVWIETATLLEATPVWSSADRTAFALWLATVAYPRVAWASHVRRNNWGAAGSAAASLIARYTDGLIFSLADPGPPAQALTPAEAVLLHDALQLQRIRTVWRGDTDCSLVGIRPHGGIPDELRRGAAGCDGTFLPAGNDPSHAYQTMHVELLVLHAEAQRRNGSTALFEERLAGGTPALLQAILFVIANPTPGGQSWPWGSRNGTLAVAYRYYDDARIGREFDRSASPTARGGRTLPYAPLVPTRPTPPVIAVD